MHKSIAFLLCFCWFIPSYSFAQDLNKATLDYFLKDHFKFNPETIAKSKIKSIEKHWYTFSDDTINQDYITEKHRFTPFGKHEYMYVKMLGFDKSENFFTYDANGNLIKEDRYGLAPSLTYKLIASYEWAYTNGTLNRQRQFLLLDKIDVEHGASYFPEKIFLFANDTLIYQLKDSSVVLLTNRPEHCKDVKTDLYPSNFKIPLTTTLKFHSNNTIRQKSIIRESIVQHNFFDPCGNPLSNPKPTEKCMKLLNPSSTCLAPEKINVCNQADTLTINKQLLYFIRTNSSHFIHDSGAGMTINQSGISYYDHNFSVVSSIDTTNYVRGTIWETKPSYSTKTIRKSKYEYFDNGLLKRITITDDQDRIIEVTENKLEYY